MTVWADYPHLADELEKLRTAGKSAGQIARILGHGISRNAVIGKINRLRDSGKDLPRTSSQSKPRAFILPWAAQGASQNKTKAPPRKPVIVPPPDEPAPIGLIEMFPDRDQSTCRYIHGEVSKPGWQLCGAPGHPWCAFHAGRFLVAPIPRKQAK